MHQRTIGVGTAGRQVSAIALGTVPFGTSVPEDTAYAILDRFVEAGGTLIDTANNYAHWAPQGTGDEAENVIGRWLASRGSRNGVLLSTKVGARPRPTDAGPPGPEGLSAKAIEDGVTASLRRLGTDHIDVYWAHVQDVTTPAEETVRAFAGLARDGRVGVLGASNHSAWRVERVRGIARAAGLPAYDCLQLRYSYLQPRPGAALPESGHVHATSEHLDYLRAEPELALFAYTTLLMGAYTRSDKPLPEAYDHPGTTRRLAALRSVAKEIGATPNQVVLAWLLGGPVPTIPIVGATSVAQLDEAMAAVDVKLDHEHRVRLDAAT